MLNPGYVDSVDQPRSRKISLLCCRRPLQSGLESDAHDVVSWGWVDGFQALRGASLFLRSHVGTAADRLDNRPAPARRYHAGHD